MVVQHNMSAINSKRQLGIVNSEKEKSAEKLGSGYKINRAADDTAGLAISEKMRRSIRGLSQGSHNVQDGISMLQVGDGALDEVTSMIHRMSELSIKSANEKMSQLERMRSDLMALAARQRTIQRALICLYKEEAHYQLEPLFKTYESQLSAKKIKQDESNGLMAEIKALRQEVQALEARKAGTDIAVGCINKSLQYIFVSDKRFTIEPCAGTYVLKSRGHNVRPADVSTGERHILALAYFFVDIMARHSTKDFYKDERIIVIDDPVSSYDQENKIGVYSFLMREIENVLAGNEKSRIVLFTHDIQTMLGLGSALESLMGCRFKQEKYAFVMKEIGDDGALKEFQRKHWHEYSCLLQEIYDFAQNGAASSHSITIGNEMRRALEVQ